MYNFLAGTTEYKNQPLREIVKDLKEVVDYSKNISKKNKGLKKENIPLDLKSCFLEIVLFSDKLVELSKKNLNKVKKDRPVLFFIQALKEMGMNANELNLNIGKIWHSGYNSRYSDTSLESIKYCELKDYIISMIDLNNIGFELEKRYFKNGKNYKKSSRKKTTIMVGIATLIVIIIIFFAQPYWDKFVNNPKLNPEIKVFLTYAGKTSETSKDIFMFAVRNSGKINIANFSVDHRLLLYIKDDKYYRICITHSNIYRELGEGWLLPEKDIIKPEEITSKRLNLWLSSLQNEKYFYVGVFDVYYYREADLKEYKEQKVFFVDKNGVVYDCPDNIKDEENIELCENDMEQLYILLKNDDWSLYEPDFQSETCIW